MLHSIGISERHWADWQPVSSPTAPFAGDAAQIRQTLAGATCAQRPQTALALMESLGDAQLKQLTSSDEGLDALVALDDALADAADHLGDTASQRERIQVALDVAVPPRDDDGGVADGAAGVSQTTAHIGDNTVTWTNDSEGRPIRAEADLSEVFKGIDRSSAETTAQRDSAGRGVEGDQGGHLIGHRFVKDQGLKNLFPQNGNFNVSAYKTLENEWADWIDSGKDVHITVDLTPKNQDRPERVRVSYEVVDPADGRVVYDQRVTFRNEAGQQFDRVPRADMANA
ncbi:MAG: DNA/RNA non-specific endonuclease [Luteimonas sp.]